MHRFTFLGTTSRAVRWLAAAVLAAIVLGGCTVYVVPGTATTGVRGSIDLDLDEVITSFSPTRGEGADYRVGQRIEFRIRTTRSGYVSLTAIDPDGSVYTFARNLRVEAGRTNILPGPRSRVAFVADPPTGLHRVRATFTEQSTDRNRVRYEGRQGEDGWTSAIRIELRAAEVRDVAETFLFITRR